MRKYNKNGLVSVNHPVIKTDIIAPYLTTPVSKPWQGCIEPKQHEYLITVTIPTLNNESLPIVIDLLNAQTIKPYIVIVDTGGKQSIEHLRQDNVEIHYLKSHSYIHASQPVAVACDLALALCQTEYLFYTHADCFLTSQTLLADWIELTKVNKVVGYQISPRPYQGWETELGHTALMVHVPTLRQNNINWSMQAYCESKGSKLTSKGFGLNDPDTESNFNRTLKLSNIKPLFLGSEANHQRNVNEHFDHVRSYASASLYCPSYLAKMEQEMQHAMREARIRVSDWTREKEPNHGSKG